MPQKERLTELLKKAKLCSRPFEDQYSDATIEKIAEHLLENGVIVPPCKAGDMVYRVVKEYNGATRVIEGEVFELSTTHAYGRKIEYRFYFWADGEEFTRRSYSLWCNFAEIGKTVFLTREEAEEALAERGKIDG